MVEQTVPLRVKRPKRKKKGSDHSLLLEDAASDLKISHLVPLFKVSIASQKH